MHCMLASNYNTYNKKKNIINSHKVKVGPDVITSVRRTHSETDERECDYYVELPSFNSPETQNQDLHAFTPTKKKSYKGDAIMTLRSGSSDQEAKCDYYVHVPSSNSPEAQNKGLHAYIHSPPQRPPQHVTEHNYPYMTSPKEANQTPFKNDFTATGRNANGMHQNYTQTQPKSSHLLQQQPQLQGFKQDTTIAPSSLYSSSPDQVDNYYLANEQTDLSSNSWKSRIEDWLFPPNVPRSCQLLRLENLAIPACYLTVGILQGLSGPFINVYPLDLQATEAQQVTISSLRSLPASLKLVFGFWSDVFPLLGYRRKSYMSLGWLTCSAGMAWLVWESDIVGLDENGNGGSGEKNPPSISFLSVCILIFGMGFWFADVMADSLVAEKAKLEPESTRGHLQAFCYSCRFFGLMVAAPLSTVLYSTHGPKIIVQLLAIVPLLVLPLIWFLREPKDVEVKSLGSQCEELWNTACSRAVWQPMGFVYIYNAMQVGNAAWREFLYSVLRFTAEQLNTLLLVAYVLLYLGVLAYKQWFVAWSWRTVYIITTLLGGFFSGLQVCLIKGWTLGLDPFWFALGDDVFGDFIGGIQFLPTMIMMVHLCPAGSEGASYAMFTTVNNSALILSAAFSTLLLGVWDVSKETMVAGDLSGMTKLTVLTTLIQTSAVLFVWLLPHSKEDLVALGDEKETEEGDYQEKGGKCSRSTLGGFVFLSVTLLTIAYSVMVGVLNVVAPGWSGESR